MRGGGISVLELGCFDGKAIEFLNNPKKYVGYDANWENGLDLAKEKWKDSSNYTFFEADTPKGFNPENEKFDISVCQETMEHLYSADLREYIQILANSTKQYCFISVPNEQGLFFLIKYLLKRVTQGKGEEYSFKELIYATLGRTDKVTRVEGGHKGFDYKKLIKLLSEYWEVVEVKGIPFSFLPKSFNFTICILLKSKTTNV